MGPLRVFVPLFGLLLALSLMPAALAAQTAAPAPPPEPPAQPATGPGGAEYAFAEVTGAQFGELPTSFWLYEPASPSGATPVPTGPLPLVLVLPGWGDPRPLQLEAWIEHIVRRGAVVVFPSYQHGTEPIPEEPGPELAPGERANLGTAIRAALAELERGSHPPVDLGRVAVVGQSFGGTLALFYAAAAMGAGLPVPRAVFASAGGCAHCPDAHLEPLRAVPAETLVLVAASEDDEIPYLVGDDPARMFASLEQVPAERRDFIIVRSDDHGRPGLYARHNVATTAVYDQVDALDWYGSWKWADALMACAFAGEWCEYALGSTPEQLFMGTWSDGVPVREPLITDNPATPTP